GREYDVERRSGIGARRQAALRRPARKAPGSEKAAQEALAGGRADAQLRSVKHLRRRSRHARITLQNRNAAATVDDEVDVRESMEPPPVKKTPEAEEARADSSA